MPHSVPNYPRQLRVARMCKICLCAWYQRGTDSCAGRTRLRALWIACVASQINSTKNTLSHPPRQTRRLYHVDSTTQDPCVTHSPFLHERVPCSCESPWLMTSACNLKMTNRCACVHMVMCVDRDRRWSQTSAVYWWGARLYLIWLLQVTFKSKFKWYFSLGYKT